MHTSKRIFLLGNMIVLTILGLLHLFSHLSTEKIPLASAGSTDNCFVHDGIVVRSSVDEQAIQQSIDAAVDGALLKVAGICQGADTRMGLTQTVYISKSITLQGGYTLTNWLMPDEIANPTVLDAQSEGRVVYITGPIQVTLDRLNMLNGFVHNGNGGGIYHNANPIETGSGIYHLSTLTVTNSVIANGKATVPGFGFPNGLGGGIAMAEGQLHIGNSLITGNQAAMGGGITIYLGQVTIQKSSIISNSVTEEGGGIILGYGMLTMTNSTVAYNHANLDGGGIGNDAESTVTLINSTLSGNAAVRNGGGLDNFLDSTATLIHTTFSHNSAGGNGGGIYNSAVITLSNSIIGNSSGGDCWHSGGIENFIDNGFNHVQDGSCGFAEGGDPQLGSLAGNGGNNWTHALLINSPALDAGNCADDTISTDQRGVARPQGGACDIGSFERERPTLFLPFISKQ